VAVLDRAALADVLLAALGPTRGLAGVVRLRGGTKKGVHRLVLDDGSSVVAYVWHPSEDHWSHLDGPVDHPDPFSHASGIDLFASASVQLDTAGVRTPRVHLPGFGDPFQGRCGA
jgi:hypothetical protein